MPDWWGLHAGQLPRGQTAVLPVLSGSMAPLLPPGVEIVIRAGDWRDCRPGDIVVFRQGADLTAHRLLLVLRLPGLVLLYEKGDANPRGRWIRAAQVAGVVLRAQREGRVLADFEAALERREARASVGRQLAADLRERVPEGVRRLVRRLLPRR